MRKPSSLLPPVDPVGPVEGFKVTSAGSALIRRPVPRNVGISLVLGQPELLRFEAIQALEPAMEIWPWLDMALRVGSGLSHSPEPMLEGLRRAFPHFRPHHVLIGDAGEWWNNATHPLTIWRGCYEGINEAGICWSQDPRTASMYVRPGGHGRVRALLLEATVEEAEYIAHRRARSELEILALPECPKVVARHALPLPEAFFVDRHVPLRKPFRPLNAYFSPSWTAFQADRGRDFSVIVDGVSV